LTDTAVPVGTRLRRGEVAELAGISKSQVRRLEGTVLHPQVGPKGVRFFAEEEVRTLVSKRRTIGAERHAGDVAAEVFQSLDAGVEPKDIVIQLRIAPGLVRDLCAQWAAMQGGLYLSGDGVARLATAIDAHKQMTEATLVDSVEGALQDADDVEVSLRERLRRAEIAADANAVFREFMGLPDGATSRRGP